MGGVGALEVAVLEGVGCATEIVNVPFTEGAVRGAVAVDDHTHLVPNHQLALGIRVVPLELLERGVEHLGVEFLREEFGWVVGVELGGVVGRQPITVPFVGRGVQTVFIVDFVEQVPVELVAFAETEGCGGG